MPDLAGSADASAPALPSPSESPPLDVPRRNGRHLLVHGLLLAAAGALLAWVISVNGPALRDVVLRGPDWKSLLAAIGLLVVESFNLTVRWRGLLDGMGVALPFSSVYRMVAGSIIANLVMPGANGGDALKIALLAAATPERTKGIASLLLDRVVGLCGLLLVGFLAGAVAWPSAPPVVRNLTLASGGLSLGVLAALFVFQSQWLHPLAERIARLHPRVASISARLTEGQLALRQRPWSIPQALLLAMAGQAINIGVFYFMARALRVEGGTLSSFLVLVPFVFLATALPLPFGAIGVTEGVSDQLFRWCGIEGGGVGMLGYRFAHTASVPVLLVILLLWTGGVPLPSKMLRTRRTVPDQDTTIAP